MSKNIYVEYIEVTDDLDAILKKCFINHLVLYNYALSVRYDNEDITFKNLKKKVMQHAKESNIRPIMDAALYNDIYYLCRKFSKNIKIQKLVTDIQYFTFLCKGYGSGNNKFTISDNRREIVFDLFPGKIVLPTELPYVRDDELLYFNLSYSGVEQRYMLSIHTTG